MRLFIAGVNHCDPLGRESLKKWLEELARTNLEPPAFVAVEFDPEYFEDIRAQRSLFQRRCHETWQSASDADLAVLMASLGYEGDTHLEVFPNAETLWLDEGRTEYDIPRDQFAFYRLGKYTDILGNRWPGSVRRVSEWIRSQPISQHDPNRSGRFARRILERVSRGGRDWAIVITGAGHTTDQAQTMRSLLESAGLTCYVTNLRSPS